MRPHIALDPGGKAGVTRGEARDIRAGLGGRLVGRRREVPADPLDVLGQQDQLVALDAGLDLGVFLLDRGAEPLDAPFAQHDLDARLVNVVPAAEAVEGAQDRACVAQQVRLRHERVHLLSQQRLPAESTTDEEAIADRSVRAAHQMHCHVVGAGGGAIHRGAREAEFELARQPVELRVQRDVLAQQLAVGPRVDVLVDRDACQIVAGDVAGVVTAGLDTVELHLGELPQQVRHLLELGQLSWMFCRVVKWP